jgi:hypothetical protein
MAAGLSWGSFWPLWFQLRCKRYFCFWQWLYCIIWFLRGRISFLTQSIGLFYYICSVTCWEICLQSILENLQGIWKVIWIQTYFDSFQETFLGFWRYICLNGGLLHFSYYDYSQKIYQSLTYQKFQHFRWLCFFHIFFWYRSTKNRPFLECLLLFCSVLCLA